MGVKINPNNYKDLTAILVKAATLSIDQTVGVFATKQHSLTTVIWRA